MRDFKTHLRTDLICREGGLDGVGLGWIV